MSLIAFIWFAISGLAGIMAVGIPIAALMFAGEIDAVNARYCLWLGAALTVNSWLAIKLYEEHPS